MKQEGGMQLKRVKARTEKLSGWVHVISQESKVKSVGDEI